jgi:hypothetical protein
MKKKLSDQEKFTATFLLADDWRVFLPTDDAGATNTFRR